MRFNRPSSGHKSYNSAINGVAKFIQTRDFSVLGNIKDPNQFGSKLNKLMRRFLKENNLKCFDNQKFKSHDLNANLVQDNFDKFKRWINDNYKNKQNEN